MTFHQTLAPYDIIDHGGISYTVARDYPHISRYRGLRQIVHSPDDIENRFISSETSNPISTTGQFLYYVVPHTEVNRLDLIANRFLGSPTYSWVIAYHNGIEDGFTVSEGQRLRILKNFTDLFNTGGLLAPVPASQFNLGSE